MPQDNPDETSHSEHLATRNSVAADIQWRVRNTSMNWPILFVVSLPAVQVHDRLANLEVLHYQCRTRLDLFLPQWPL